jgi:hypothetical protein
MPDSSKYRDMVLTRAKIRSTPPNVSETGTALPARHPSEKARWCWKAMQVNSSRETTALIKNQIGRPLEPHPTAEHAPYAAHVK